MNRAHQAEVLVPEDQDETLRVAREKAKVLGLWVSLGSLALQPKQGERFVNRSVLIAPDGEIAARYDKMHMFDVDLPGGESYRESSGYAPGDAAVLSETPFGTLGLTICYDLRFPYLFRTLAQAGAKALLVPSAFSVPTGKAHWEVLLRARAIETGSFVIAAAQTGEHPAQSGAMRRTYGHSLVVSPWGEVLLDAGTDPGLFMVDLDLKEADKCRARIPSLASDRSFALRP